jgi:hypothetical protein
MTASSRRPPGLPRCFSRDCGDLMAHRVTATHRATPSGAAASPCPATGQAAAALAAESRPCAGLPLVLVLARPAADFSVTEPDAAQTPAPSCPPVTTVRALRPACRVLPSATGAPFGAAAAALSSWVRAGWIVGCSIGSVRVHAVSGTRSSLDMLR